MCMHKQVRTRSLSKVTHTVLGCLALLKAGGQRWMEKGWSLKTWEQSPIAVSLPHSSHSFQLLSQPTSTHTTSSPPSPGLSLLLPPSFLTLLFSSPTEQFAPLGAWGLVIHCFSEALLLPQTPLKGSLDTRMTSSLRRILLPVIQIINFF